MTTVIASLALALLLVVAALAREVRLRRALQALLHRLLTHWRNRFGNRHPYDNSTHPDDADDNRRL